MALMPGLHEVTITSNGIKALGDKQAAWFDFESEDGSTGQFLIWFTEKAAKIAVMMLKRCGFDATTMDLDALIDDPGLLRGNRVQVMAEETDRGIRYSLPINSTPETQVIKSLQTMLRMAAPAKADDSDDIPF